MVKTKSLLKDKPIINQIIRIGFLITVSLLIVLGTYFYYDHDKKIWYRNKSQELEAIAKLKTNELVSWRKEKIANAQLTSTLPFLVEYLNEENHITHADKIDALLQNIIDFFEYQAIFISLPNGEIINSKGSDLTEFNNELLADIILATKQDTIVAKGLYYCKTEAIIHYDIIAPVHNKDNIPVGAIVFRSDPDKFIFPNIQIWPTSSKSSETLLLKEENDSVLFLNELRHKKNTALSLKIPLSETNVPAVRAITGYTGVLRGIDYRGVEVVAYVSPVEGTDWYMVSKIDRDELMSDLRFNLKVFIFTSVFILLFFGVGIAWIYSIREKDTYKMMLETQKEFRTTLYSIADAVITTDNQGRIKQMNKVAEQLMGLKETEVTGKHIESVCNVINEETKEKIEELFKKIIANGNILGQANHTLLITQHGGEIPISGSGAPIRNKVGEIVGAVLVFREQAEERKTQNLIAKRLELLEYSGVNNTKALLQKTINDICLLTHSPHGFFYSVDSNQRSFKLITCSSGILNKTEVSKFNAANVPLNKTGIIEECINLRKAVIKNGSSLVTNNTYEEVSDLRIMNELALPVIKEGAVVAIVVVNNKANEYEPNDIDMATYLVDIAFELVEKKKKAEILDEEQRLFNSLINNVPDNIYFKDRECRFIRINLSLTKKLGLDKPEDAIGKVDADFFGKEHGKQTYIDEKLIISTGKPLINVEEEEDWDDGPSTWVSSTKVPMLDSKGNIKGIMGISRDITDRKKMEGELIAAKNKAEQSDRLKSSFLANMSHEIRTPLNGVIGFSEILARRDNLKQKEKEHYSSIVKKSAKSLIQVIDDILDISRIEAGDINIEAGPFSLWKTLEELNTIYRKKIIELQKNVEIVLLSNTNIYLISDENRFRQVFVNLLDNAIKFTKEGKIHFGLETIEANKAVFFVRDTGMGIPEDMHEHIFERFRQVESKLTRAIGGNGLGLSIVKNLIKLMGGEIWMESEVGKGSTFKFSIPYIPVEKQSEIEEEVHSAQKVNKELKILLVEDDSVSKMFLEETLKPYSEKIVHVGSGEQALSKLNSESFDVILMDIGLPDMSGLDLARKIRQNKNPIYIIVQTAYANHSDEKQSKLAGCNDFISKPINTDKLIDKLAKINKK